MGFAAGAFLAVGFLGAGFLGVGLGAADGAAFSGVLGVSFRGSGVVHLGDTFFPNDGQPFLFPGEDPEAFLRDLAVLEAELPNLPEGALVLSGHAPPVSVDALRAHIEAFLAHLVTCLDTDPHELTNLFDRPEHRDRVRDMAARIRIWQDATGDTMTLPAV